MQTNSINDYQGQQDKVPEYNSPIWYNSSTKNNKTKLDDDINKANWMKGLVQQASKSEAFGLLRGTLISCCWKYILKSPSVKKILLVSSFIDCV